MNAVTKEDRIIELLGKILEKLEGNDECCDCRRSKELHFQKLESSFLESAKREMLVRSIPEAMAHFSKGLRETK